MGEIGAVIGGEEERTEAIDEDRRGAGSTVAAATATGLSAGLERKETDKKNIHEEGGVRIIVSNSSFLNHPLSFGLFPTPSPVIVSEEVSLNVANTTNQSVPSLTEKQKRWWCINQQSSYRAVYI